MIEPFTGPAIIEALNGINATMQGQSIADAYNQKITGQYSTDNGPTIGFADYTSDKPAISGDTSGTISTGSGNTPVDAWNDYVENTPSVTVSDTTGGIVSGSKVGTLVYSIMEENPGLATAAAKAIVPVGVPLIAAITAIGQACGISIDAANLDDGTKETLVNSYLSVPGAVYDKAKNLVTAWKDEWGRILFPKKAFDSVNDAISELGIGEESKATSSVIRGSVPYYSGEVVTGSRGTVTFLRGGTASTVYGMQANRVYIITASASPFTYITGNYFLPSMTEQNVRRGSAGAYTLNGLKVYLAVFSTVGDTTMYPIINPGDTNNVAWTLIYGNITEGGYPEGTSESQANKYTSGTIPIAGNLATSYDPDSGVLGAEPLVPIHITDDPYNSTGSTIDPTTPTDDENAGVIYPGIPKEVPDTENPDADPREESVPIPIPIPDTNVSNPDVPLTDASVVDSTLINELVEDLANTLDPQPGQSTGIIPIPPMPGIIDPETGGSSFPSIVPASGSGFIHVYNPTPSEFVSFGNWLWVTYADASIDKIWNNPFDGVIGAHELYSTPNRDGRDNIRSGFLTCPTSADLVRNRYTEIDCGTVIVPEFYGNYLDYSPYSQAYIYLPFIGINEVSIDDIVGHAVNIRYRVDAYSGSCIAMIFVAKNGYQNLCYQFAGSCSVEVPMAGGSQAAIKAGMMQAEAYARAQVASAAISAAQQVGTGIASGTVPGMVMGGLGGLGTVAAGMYGANQMVEAARVANKSSVQHSGQFGASHGAMGEKVPFIIIRNPIQVKVVNYNDDYGFPAHKRVIVGGCTGYLRVREVNVISAHATDSEKALIEQMLKNGVYVS